jgi:N-acetylneuraminic acid mutarotase
MLIGWPIWGTSAPLPQPLAGSGCAIIADTIYVIGGRDSSGNRYATNYAYDLSTQTWNIRTSMSSPRAHLGCAVVNGKIYAFGGWVGATATGVVEEYDPLTDTWTYKTPMPTPRYTIAVAAVADKIYVIGGMNMQGQIFNTVEEYDPVGDTWTTKASMPTQRMGPGCAVINDMIYVFGGSTMIGGGETAVNERYDPVSNSWFPRASMLNARYAVGGFADEIYAYAIGGYDYWNYHTTLEQYDPTYNSWSLLDPMQYGRQSVAVATIQGPPFLIVHVIGGWNNGAFDYHEEGWFGNAIEEHETAQQLVTVDVKPNPFRHSTDIRCAIQYTESTNQNLKLQIYDISGRLVNDLSREVSITGNQLSVRWYGTDNEGGILPNGTYVLIVKSNEITKTEKLVLLR